MLATERDLTVKKQRYVTKAVPAEDGAGVKISRIAGAHLNPYLDPFLLIDEINSDDAAEFVGGFPPHPHRGFETFTYMLEGRFRHRDSMGNEGMVESGGAQWMSAASGVIHSEMPEPSGKLMRGFQLWLNLPAAEKMSAPQYRDIPSEAFPVHKKENVMVKVLMGEANLGYQVLTAPLTRSGMEASVLDVSLGAKMHLDLFFEPEHQVSVYVYDGDLNDLGHRHLGVYGEGEQLNLTSDHGARLLVLSGMPLREPIAQYGPFVMNSMEEINQAIEDYNAGRLVQPIV